MIAYLQGTIEQKTVRSVVVVTNGVGYEVFVVPTVLEKIKAGDTITLYTYQHVREDILELYGFLALADRDFFQLLIGVSGVGPKSGLTIMSLTSLEDLQAAIAQGDASLLTKVSGIGKKTAERLIVELKSKIGVIDKAGARVSSSDGEAIDALVELGYSIREAREALTHVDTAITNPSEKVQAALKVLGKQ